MDTLIKPRILEEEETRLARPWVVILYNDDWHPYDQVVFQNDNLFYRHRLLDLAFASPPEASIFCRVARIPLKINKKFSQSILPVGSVVTSQDHAHARVHFLSLDLMTVRKLASGFLGL